MSENVPEYRWHEPYTASAVKGDRLNHWQILGGVGRVQFVVAEKIRTEGVARLFAEAPLMRDKLAGIKKICNDSLQNVVSTAPVPEELSLARATKVIGTLANAIHIIEQLIDARD